MQRDDPDRLVVKLGQIYRWTRKSLGYLSQEQLHEAHQLGNEIIQMLNERETVTNAVKFIALFEALALGADIMEVGAEALHAMLQRDDTTTIQ